MPKPLLSVLPLVCLASCLSARAFTIADLPHVRCVSNYLYGEDADDVAAWERDLDRMQQNGLNTVWMVNVWAAYEPEVEPPVWREDRITALRSICAAAQQRNMNLLLVLAYVGEGWGPKGLDVPVWPLIVKHRRQHLEHLRRMVRETRDFPNVFYLLCTEEILPGTLLYEPTKRPECIASFREWARETNPDVAYWNDRWATTYTWDDLSPADTSHRPRWQLWADHARWHGWLMRRLLPPMVAAIREERPDAIIGFHDFLMPDPALGLTVADGGLELPTPLDFYSIGYYYDAGLEGGYEGNVQKLHSFVERAKGLYPTLPLFCGELGLPARTEPPEALAEDEALQARFLTEAVRYLEEQQVGFSLWCWRTAVPDAKSTHSLIRPDGTATPALEQLRDLWHPR